MRKFLLICLIVILGIGMLSACAAHQPTPHRLDNGEMTLPELNEDAKITESISNRENEEISRIIDGNWLISEYAASAELLDLNPVPEDYNAHLARTKEIIIENVNHTLVLNSDTVTNFFAPSETGFFYESRNELFFGYQVPFELKAPIVYICINHIDYEKPINFIQDGAGNTFIEIDYTFFKLENCDAIENTDVTENVDVVEASVTDYFLPPEYDYIHAFKGGYGMISKGDVMQLINAEGQIISPPTPTTCIISSINQNKKIEIESLENQLYGLMDMDGNILIAPEYEYPLMFSEGLASIIQDGKISYINENNEVVIASRYDWALSFHCELAAVGIDDEFWFIDTEGNIASGPYEYLDAEIFTFTPAYMDYYEGYTAYFEYDSEMDPQGYNPGGYWGYLNKKGEEVIPAQFISVRPFHEGLAAAQKKDGQWIYINTEGKEVFNGAPCDFNEGLACLGGSFINKLGETVITLPENYYVPHSTVSGFDNFHHGLIVLFADNKGKSFNAVMNRSGEILLESNDYEEIKVIYENLIAVKTNGKWGVIDLS